MASAIIVYYSISGTTRCVAEQIADGLLVGGIECALHDLRADGAPDLTGFAVVGIGSPVHYYRLPPPVSQALNGLGRLEGVSSFSFVLHGTYRGIALNAIRSGLARAGTTEIGVFTSFGQGLFLGYLREGYLFSAAHPDSRDLERAREFGVSLPAVHQTVATGGVFPRMPQRDPDIGVVYRIERALARPEVSQVVYSQFFSADPQLCSRCGRCARECPAGNIAAAPGDLPLWGHDCIICATCVTACPEDAVRCPIDWAVFKPFLRYNTSRAGRDPAIEHARVRFERGRIDGKLIRSRGRPTGDSRAVASQESEPTC